MQKQIYKHFKKLDIHEEKKETDIVQKSSGNINI